MSDSVSGLLRKAKTDEQLAQEVLAGGLAPDKHSAGRKPLGEANHIEEDETDEVNAQIKMLLQSALNSGQLRSLARAIVLAWQAGYDSPLLRQAEPKLVKKAKEVKLTTDINNAIEQRSRVMLTDCLNRANELGLTECNFPTLTQAKKIDAELEEEAKSIQDEARPGHTKLMSSVIGELSNQMFGVDIGKLQAEVETLAESAKEAMAMNNEKLKTSLEVLDEYRSQSASSEKLNKLKGLSVAFSEINPRNLEEQLATQISLVEELRADNAELMLALRSQGTRVVTLSSASGEAPVDAVEMAEEVETLKAKISEMEETEEVLRGRIDQAAKLGAKWMEDKKQEEIDQLKTDWEAGIEAAKEEVRSTLETQQKRKLLDISKNEKKLKVVALKGLEEALTKKHTAEIQQLKVQHKQETTMLKEELAEAERRLKQLEKIIKVRG